MAAYHLHLLSEHQVRRYADFARIGQNVLTREVLMRRTVLRSLSVLAAAAIALPLLTLPGAAIGPTPNPVPVQAPTAADSGSGGYVIVHPTETSGGTFYPTGSIDSDTTVVIAEPDGSLPGGLTEDQIAALIASQSSDYARSLGFYVADSPSSEH